MAKENALAVQRREVHRFVKQLNAAFGSRMSADARELYYQELCKWHLSERAWNRAMGLLTGSEDLDRAPTLAKIYDYLKQADREIRQEMPGRWAVVFDMPDGRRYWRSYAEGSENTFGRVPDGASNIHRFPECVIDNKSDWEGNPLAYPEGAPTPDGTFFKVSEAGLAEIRELCQSALEEHVTFGVSDYEARLIVLTDGKRGSMLKRDLAPLEAAARAWAETADSTDTMLCRQQALVILGRMFANVQTPDDLMQAAHTAPADYDDSEQALGRQRAAQLERLEQAERSRRPFEDF